MTLCGNRVSNLQAGILLNQKMTELSESISWSWLKADALLAIKASKSIGTVAVTNGSTSIVGTGTSFASTDVGGYIRVATDVGFYKITVVAGQTLTIESAYVGNDASGQGFNLFFNIYTLPSNFRQMLTPVFYNKLNEATLEELGAWDPMRSSQSNNPTHFTYRGIDSAGLQEIEIWPVPSAAIAFRFSYLKTIAEATTDSTVFPIRPDVLTYAVAADVLTVEIAKDPVKNAALASVVTRYDTRAETALAEAWFADMKKQGVPDSIADAAELSHVSGDYAVDHDTYGL